MTKFLLENRRSVKSRDPDFNIVIPFTGPNDPAITIWQSDQLNLDGYTLVNGFLWFTIRNDSQPFSTTFVSGALVIQDGSPPVPYETRVISSQTGAIVGTGSYSIPLLRSAIPAVGSTASVSLAVHSDNLGPPDRVMRLSIGCVVVAGMNTDLRR